MSAIAIIPARGGSRRIPRKNIKDFHGKPIIAYSILTAKESGLFACIKVSTDDKEIARVAGEYGAEVDWRDPSLCRNAIGTQEVMTHVVRAYGYPFACCIYATAPLMSVRALEEGYAAAATGGYAFSVGYPPLCDAGQFYWGPVEYFINEVPLINPGTTMIHVATERVCDIDTMEDFSRAEEMYSKLHGLGDT